MVDTLDRLENAKKSLKVADHMLTITHNVVNDPKLLILVLQKIFNTLHNVVGAILYHDLYHRKIPPFSEDYQTMMGIFKVRCIRRYSLDTSYIQLVQDVFLIYRDHKKSAMEFRRHDKYVICSDTYGLKVVTKENLKKYIEQTKNFIKDAEKMITK